MRRRKSSVRSYFTLGPAAVVRLCATVALLGSVGLAAAAAGPDVGIVELLLVRADSTSSVTFESGHYRVEGDVYVTAVLENRGDVAAEAYVVDFFYKEAITERTGRIGSGPVEGYGIAPTQEGKKRETARPSVRWETGKDVLSDGVYQITAAVRLLQQTDAEPSNNTFPALPTAEQLDAPRFTVFISNGDEGVLPASPYPFTPATGTLQDGTRFVPASGCVYGDSFFVSPVQLGTSFVNLSDKGASIQNDQLGFGYRYAKPDEEGNLEWYPAQGFEPTTNLWQVADPSNSFDPGETATIKTTLSPAFLVDVMRGFSAEKPTLGMTYEVQVAFQRKESEVWSLALPTTGGSLRYTTPADAWIFGDPAECSTGEGDIPEGAVRPNTPPTVDTNSLVFVVRNETRPLPSGETGTGDVVYALSSTQGDPVWAEPITAFLEKGRTLTSVAVYPDPDSTDGATLFYVGWSESSGDGGVTAYRNAKESEGEWKATVRWSTDPADGAAYVIQGMSPDDVEEVVSAPTVGLRTGVELTAASIADIRIFVSSQKGVWRISDAATASGVTTTQLAGDSVEESPLYLQDTGRVWYVNDDNELHYVPAEGGTARRLVAGDAGEEITAPLTESSVNEDETVLFVGTEDGNIHAITTGKTTGGAVVDPQWVASVNVAGSSDIHAVFAWSRRNSVNAQVFSASDSGEIVECQFAGSSFSGQRKVKIDGTTVTLSTDENTGLLVIGGLTPEWLYVTSKQELHGYTIPDWGESGDYGLAVVKWSGVEIVYRYSGLGALTPPAYDDLTLKLFVASEDGDVRAFREASI